MTSVSATEAKQRFAAIIDAAQREPVRIRRQKRDVAVILSAEEYDRIRGANVEELDRLCERVSRQAAERGLTDEILTELLKD
jgi:prevent-host-death family protein